MRTTRIATLGILIMISSGCQGMPGLKRHSRDSSITHSARTPVSKWGARPSLESDETKVAEASKVGLIRKVSFQEDVEDDEKVSRLEAEADDQKKSGRRIARRVARRRSHRVGIRIEFNPTRLRNDSGINPLNFAGRD